MTHVDPPEKIVKRVFVIMPFVKTLTRNGTQLERFFEDNIKAAIEKGEKLENEYLVYRSGDAFNITEQIIRDLYEADIVVADLSGEPPNPNVMYELGVRLAVSPKPVLLIREDHASNTKVFDVGHFYVHPYDPMSLGELEQWLVDKIRRQETGEDEYESPVAKIVQSQIALKSASEQFPPEVHRDLVIRGAALAARAAAKAFGPFGSFMPIASIGRLQTVGREGVAVANATSSRNPVEMIGIWKMLDCAGTVHERAGDGVKTSLLLADVILAEGAEAIASGNQAHDVCAGIRAALEVAVPKLQELVLEGDRLLDIMATASRDRELSQAALSAMDNAGELGLITLEGAIGAGFEIILDEGIQLDRGVLAERFLAKSGSSERVLEKPYVLIHDRKISAMSQLAPLLGKVAETGRAILIVAPAVEGEALAMLLRNDESGVLDVVAIKAPGHGERRGDVLEDLAVLTGGVVISEDSGYTLENTSLDQLGSAAGARVSINTAAIIDGDGSSDSKAARVKWIRSRIGSTGSAYDDEKLAERLTWFGGKRVVLRLMAPDDHQLRDVKYRVGRAMHLASAGRTQGVPGGGSAFMSIKGAVVRGDDQPEQWEPGFDAVRKALGSLATALVESTGKSWSSVIPAGAEESLWENSVFDVPASEVRDVTEANILDSVDVLQVALESAVQVACEILETAEWDVDAAAKQLPA